MINVNIQFESVTEAAQFFARAAYSHTDKAPAPVVAAPAVATKPKAEKPPAPAPAPTPAAAPAAPEAAATDVLDYAVLQKAVFALVGKKTGAAMAPILEHFGVASMKVLPEGKRHEALAMVEAALA